MVIAVDTVAYLLTWADEIAARANRVRNLIGSAHWPSDGAYKEHLLREILQRHIPQYLHTARGFIRPLLDSDICSPEIDILVSDPSRHVPLFNEGSLQVVVPTSVIATIEVKSTYATPVVRKALESTALSRSCCLDERRAGEIWSAIFITSSSDNFDLAGLHQVLEEFAGRARLPCRAGAPRIDPRRLLPQCVAVQGGGIALIAEVNDDQVQIRTFECPTMAISLALAQCFSHIQSVTRLSDSPGELEDLLRTVDFNGRQFNTTVRVPQP